MKDEIAGITRANEGMQGITWNILGQTYVPKHRTEHSEKDKHQDQSGNRRPRDAQVEAHFREGLSRLRSAEFLL